MGCLHQNDVCEPPSHPTIALHCWETKPGAVSIPPSVNAGSSSYFPTPHFSRRTDGSPIDMRPTHAQAWPSPSPKGLWAQITGSGPIRDLDGPTCFHAGVSPPPEGNSAARRRSRLLHTLYNPLIPRGPDKPSGSVNAATPWHKDHGLQNVQPCTKLYKVQGRAKRIEKE